MNSSPDPQSAGFGPQESAAQGWPQDAVTGGTGQGAQATPGWWSDPAGQPSWTPTDQVSQPGSAQQQVPADSAAAPWFDPASGQQFDPATGQQFGAAASAQQFDQTSQPSQNWSTQGSTGPYGQASGPGHEGFDPAWSAATYSSPAASAFGPHQSAASVTAAPTTTPKRRGRAAMGLLALTLVAAGVGGGVVAVSQPTAGAQAQPTATVTRVVNSDGSSPDWSAVAAAATPSVVSIKVSSGNSTGEGSGVIWDSQGHIVTNNHVVTGAGSNASITVQLGEASYAATVVGTDPASDLAVIKLTDPPTGLTPIQVADQVPAVGDPVMAIGNPLGLSSTVTTGIVSALNRPVTTSDSTESDPQQGRSQTQSQTSTVVTNAIQTSAPINPGNSGGALVNASGELVGINSSIATLSSGGESGSIGIGFAIGASQVSWVADALISTGEVSHASLGVQVSDVRASDSGTTQLGAQISAVTTGTPAATAGIKAGDVVTAVNGATVDSADGLVAQIRALKPGTTIEVTLLRNGAKQTVKVKLTS